MKNSLRDDLLPELSEDVGGQWSDSHVGTETNRGIQTPGLPKDESVALAIEPRAIALRDTIDDLDATDDRAKDQGIGIDLQIILLL
jgi:hypothetical protein